MRTLGWIFTALGCLTAAASVASVGFDIMSPNRSFGWLGVFRPVGSFWSDIHLESLQLLQPAIERHVNETLYIDYVQPILLLPAVPFFAVCTVVLLLFGGLCRLGGNPVRI